MRTLMCFVSLIGVVCIVFTFLVLGLPKEVTFADLQATEITEEHIEIIGYMSPLLGETPNYFYLTQTPYCMELQLSKENKCVTNTVPVYLKVTDDSREVNKGYTNQLLKVSGDLIKGEYKDNNQFYNKTEALQPCIARV